MYITMCSKESNVTYKTNIDYQDYDLSSFIEVNQKFSRWNIAIMVIYVLLKSTYWPSSVKIADNKTNKDFTLLKVVPLTLLLTLL